MINWRSPANNFFTASESSGRLDGVHGNGEGLRLADDHHQTLTARDCRIQKIALEHRVVLGSQGYDHRRELRAWLLWSA